MDRKAVDRKEERRRRRMARKQAAAGASPPAHDALQAAGRFFRAGDLDKAAQILENVLRGNPENFEATFGLGIIHATGGNVDAALQLFERAVAIKPDDADAHYNLGLAHHNKGNHDKAAAAYRRSIDINPNEEGPHNNLGNLLKDRGDMAAAAESYRRALDINPNQAVALSNLGIVFQEQDRLDDALSHHQRALGLDPNAPELWKNFSAALKIQAFLASGTGEKFDPATVLDALDPAARAAPDFALLQYDLLSSRPAQAGAAYDNALAALPTLDSEAIAVDDSDPSAPPYAPEPENIVALIHFGRSGTGLLHSLIDGHPEISTLPGIYLKGFFNAGIWAALAAQGWRRLPERFADLFEVLFDARSAKPIPGLLGEDNSFLGQKEGMTAVGEGGDEFLAVDRAAFCGNALNLIKRLKKIDPRSFFLIVHAAFEASLSAHAEKSLIFYHLHHGALFTKFNFFRCFPAARLVMMVREPIQSCESWIRDHFRSNTYAVVADRIHITLFDIDRIEFQRRDTVGVRLEDLKKRPEATLQSLCAWLGVKESPSLYEMTAQGKKWWGESSSPDYDPGKGFEAFDDRSINRPVGLIFSERDRLVLATLFYPFSVRFGYADADPDGFEENLKIIRPMLDDLFDFEKAMAARSGLDDAAFKRQGSYRLLRAGLIERWRTLDELADYPGMVAPLPIDGVVH